jgi:hypothetical protein
MHTDTEGSPVSCGAALEYGRSAHKTKQQQQKKQDKKIADPPSACRRETGQNPMLTLHDTILLEYVWERYEGQTLRRFWLV